MIFADRRCVIKDFQLLDIFKMLKFNSILYILFYILGLYLRLVIYVYIKQYIHSKVIDK